MTKAKDALLCARMILDQHGLLEHLVAGNGPTIAEVIERALEELKPEPQVLIAELPCSRCGEPLGDDTFVGDGDGTGQQFAHYRCSDRGLAAARRGEELARRRLRCTCGSAVAIDPANHASYCPRRKL